MRACGLVQCRRRRYHPAMSALTPTQQQRITHLIETLGLEAHVEGGYFRRHYEPGAGRRLATEHGERFSMTCIYYLLTADSPIGLFHRNRADIVHFYHAGDPLTYYLLGADGQLRETVLGADLVAGQHPQLVVAGGTWKASRLKADGRHGYTLLGEAVSPGFEYEDMELADSEILLGKFPQYETLIRELSKKS